MAEGTIIGTGYPTGQVVTDPDGTKWEVWYFPGILNGQSGVFVGYFPSDDLNDEPGYEEIMESLVDGDFPVEFLPDQNDGPPISGGDDSETRDDDDDGGSGQLADGGSGDGIGDSV
jgi:hypothetical protein